MGVVGYFNIWNRWAYDNHPDWRMLKANGRFSVWDLPDTVPTRFRVCCMNSDAFREYVRAQVADLAGRYDLEGLWIDMIGWNGTVCYCHNCREKYFRETGHELPDTIDWSSPEWARFVTARERWFLEFQQMVDTAARSARPGLTVTFQCGSWTQGWGSGCTPELFAIGDFLAGDFYGDAIEQSVICKALAAYTRNKPIEFMTSRCANLYYHTTTKSYRELRMAACSAFAHNASFTFIDAIDPVGTISDRFYETMGRLYVEVERIKDHLHPDASPVTDVGLYTNMLSAFDPSLDRRSMLDAPSTVSPLPPLMNLGGILLKAHIPFEILTPSNLERFPNVQLIVLPQIRAMEAKEVNALRAFVAEGGALLVTGSTGLWDGQKAVLKDSAVSDLTGVHVSGPFTPEDLTYMAPTPRGQALMPENDDRYPMQVASGQWEVTADKDVEVLARMVLPISSSKEAFVFGSAISNPPGRPTTVPSITVRTCGKGRVLFVNAPLENEKNNAQKAVLLNLVRFLLARPLKIVTNAPSWVEVLSFHDEGKKVMQLFLVKTLHEWIDAVANDVDVDVEIPAGIRSVKDVRDVMQDSPVPFEVASGRLKVRIPRMDDFVMLSIQVA